MCDVVSCVCWWVLFNAYLFRVLFVFGVLVSCFVCLVYCCVLFVLLWLRCLSCFCCAVFVCVLLVGGSVLNNILLC